MKPATALPWKDGPVFQREGRALFWTDTSKPGRWQRRLDGQADGVIGQQDAAYIVHAANNYQRLVQALEKFITGSRKAEHLAWECGSESDDGILTLLNDSRGDAWRELTDAQVAARALLSELGEG